MWFGSCCSDRRRGGCEEVGKRVELAGERAFGWKLDGGVAKGAGLTKWYCSECSYGHRAWTLTNQWASRRGLQ